MPEGSQNNNSVASNNFYVAVESYANYSINLNQMDSFSMVENTPPVRVNQLVTPKTNV